MSKISASFVLGKASVQHGANVEHNNREFIAGNVDVKRISDNVTYVKQDVRDAYEELFGEAVKEYNAKQKQPCRRIKDYYEHISKGKREEAFYELVVQFGDSKTAPVGSENGETVKKMLDDYIKDFKKRNPNLYIFNAVLHMDEASPHLHIDVIPFYTEKRKNGLSKGVSMKSALDAQGFTAKGVKENQLVTWEDNERGAMKKILERHGYEYEHKNVKHKHMSVEEYKEYQDAQKLSLLKKKKLSPEELSAQNIEGLKRENTLLKIEKEKLTEEKFSPYKSFYFSSPDKQAFVQSKLDEMKIPYRETENGFEAQECYVNEIRKIEKDFKNAEPSFRNQLRDNLDKVVMQSKTFDEVLERLEKIGYEIKRGKYIAAKPKYGNQFIRFKSLVENYSEQSLRNRIVGKQRYEADLDRKIGSSKNQDALDAVVLKTFKHYTVVFAADVLPMKKINQNKPFTWTNDAELDKLSALNKKINAGATFESLRKNFTRLEKSVAEKEKKIADLKKEIKFFGDLYEAGKRCFENGGTNQSDLKLLSEHKITRGNYRRIEELIGGNEKEIAEIEKTLPEERKQLKEAADIFGAAEKIIGGTYVQSLIETEKERRQAEYVNGMKRAD